MKTADNAIAVLEDETGCSMEELAWEATYDSRAASVCMNDGCTFTTEMEPDQSQGYCEVCNTRTVKSILVLVGVI